MLMSVAGLNQVCPSIKINPIINQGEGSLTTANGSTLDLVGSVNLHFRFNGPSIVLMQDGTHQLGGPTLEYWYPVQVAVFSNFSAIFIMTASLIRTHEIDYANNPAPTVSTREGKWFPFFRDRLSLSNEKCSVGGLHRRLTL